MRKKLTHSMKKKFQTRCAQFFFTLIFGHINKTFPANYIRKCYIPNYKEVKKIASMESYLKNEILKMKYSSKYDGKKPASLVSNIAIQMELNT